MHRRGQFNTECPPEGDLEWRPEKLTRLRNHMDVSFKRNSRRERECWEIAASRWVQVLGISTGSERVVLKRKVRNQVTESLTNRTKEFGLYSVDNGSSWRISKRQSDMTTVAFYISHSRRIARQLLRDWSRSFWKDRQVMIKAWLRK